METSAGRGEHIRCSESIDGWPSSQEREELKPGWLGRVGVINRNRKLTGATNWGEAGQAPVTQQIEDNVHLHLCFLTCFSLST